MKRGTGNFTALLGTVYVLAMTLQANAAESPVDTLANQIIAREHATLVYRDEIDHNEATLSHPDARSIGIGQTHRQMSLEFRFVEVRDPTHRGSEQDESGHPVGVSEGRLEGDESTHGAAHEPRAIETNSVQHGQQISHIGELARWRCGLSKSRSVVSHHRRVRRK